MKHFGMTFLLLASTAGATATPSQGVLGLWTEPTGSTIEIYRCGQAACARLVGISSEAPSKLDIHNPDPKLRTEPLCALIIGRDFQMPNANEANGGHLYDPKSGKTYRGSMTSDGDRLELRGYVGLKLFGRTEVWTRSKQGVVHCATG